MQSSDCTQTMDVLVHGEGLNVGTRSVKTEEARRTEIDDAVNCHSIRDYAIP